MRRLLLVANPSASGFTGARFRDVVRVLGESFDVTPIWPGGPDGSRLAATTAAEEGWDVVAAMGGDGVVHHVANGLVGTDTALAIIPVGTTNVLNRILGFPSNPLKAAAAIAAGSRRSVPVTAVVLDPADGGPPRRVYATFAFGAGYDADVVTAAEAAPHRKFHFGGVHYATNAVRVLLGDYRDRPPNLRVECNGDVVDAVATLVQVYDPYTYFGRLPLSLHPGAEPTHLDAAAFESLDPATVARILARLATRRPLAGAKGVRGWSGFGKLVADAEPPVAAQADGEHLGHVLGFEVSPAPNALQVVG